MPVLPDQLSADLLRALNSVAEEARKPLEEKLAQSQAEANEAAATQRAIDAEKAAVGAQAHLDGERSAKTALEAQVADLQRKVQQLEAEAARAAAAEAAVAGLRDQVGLLNDTNALLRGMVPKAPAS